MTNEEIKTETGTLDIHSENIMPIIKKWLYSEKEIFLREVVSNAFDAITKLRRIADSEKLANIPAPLINIVPDEKEKTLTIKDTGLGLDAEEVKKYINQIAFSGAEEFVNKYYAKDEQSQIIGHFGLGFYSAFMVSKKVEISSLSYKEAAEPILWSCDGSTTYELKVGQKKDIGTDIILYLDDENLEFLKEDRLKELVKRFSNFLPVEIQVNGVKSNYMDPLWAKQPKDVDKEAYLAFYQELFPFSQPPLFWIHLNVDYPFNLKGILYFPKLMHEMDAKKGEVKLFCNQVFVSDHAKEVLPEFLTLLRGAIDCPDIPLNVSRSYLQNDPYVKKISNHIVKKVADKLKELFTSDRADYEKFWEDIHPFIKYGMMNNSEFYDRMADYVIFKASTDSSTTIPEYLERNKEKLPNTVLYCSDKETQSTYIEMCKSQGLEVLFTHAIIDSHFISLLESKNTETKWKSVESDLSEYFVDTSGDSEVVDPETNKTAKDRLADLYTEALKAEKLTIKVETLKDSQISAMIVQPEHSKRMKNMGMFMSAGMPQDMFNDYTLVVNANNKVNQNVLQLSANAEKAALATDICQQVYDLALMAYQPLTGEKIQKFLSRAQALLGQISDN